MCAWARASERMQGGGCVVSERGDRGKAPAMRHSAALAEWSARPGLRGALWPCRVVRQQRPRSFSIVVFRPARLGCDGVGCLNIPGCCGVPTSELPPWRCCGRPILPIAEPPATCQLGGGWLGRRVTPSAARASRACRADCNGERRGREAGGSRGRRGRARRALASRRLPPASRRPPLSPTPTGGRRPRTSQRAVARHGVAWPSSSARQRRSHVAKFGRLCSPQPPSPPPSRLHPPSGTDGRPPRSAMQRPAARRTRRGPRRGVGVRVPFGGCATALVSLFFPVNPSPPPLPPSPPAPCR